MTSCFSIFEQAAAAIPDKPLFIFPETRSRSEEILTYGALATGARAAARSISAYAGPGERALLLFPAGAAFWECFLGCLCSGVIAVPLNIPNLNRSSDQLQQICRDCSPSVVLTDRKTCELLRRRAEKHPYFSHLPLITPEEWRAEPARFDCRCPGGEATAFLQYTSGSTANPKGVEVSHQNLLANAEMIRQQMGIRSSEDSGVTWLPHYHDMGLVGSYFVTAFTRNTSWCLQPEDFVTRPAIWLQLISQHRASICGGPDFGFRLCFDKITDEQLEGVDLSSWRVAYVGAERIRQETICRFEDRFSAAGFRRNVFFPCYGLGEATLMATGGPAGVTPAFRRVSRSGLMAHRVETPCSENDATTIAGSGQTFDGVRVAILDLATGTPLPDDQVGEIFLSGPSVTKGYFNRRDLNAELFRRLVTNGQSQQFLRTGDLGFLSRGILFVTGRTREMIIIRGRNLCPDDIEQCIADAHESLADGGVVAFAADNDSNESLVIIAELRRSSLPMAAPSDVFAAIRQKTVEGFGVAPAVIALVAPASLLRTSSGKPRRLAIRDSYLDGTLVCLFRENP